MISRLIGPFIVFLLVSIGSIAAYYLVSSVEEKERAATSGIKEAKGTIRVGLDGYAGYFPLRSSGFKSALLKKGYRVAYDDDGGNYAERVEKIARGDLDMAVFTIDSYVLNGDKENYPGSIVAILSESRGSDAIVAKSDAIKTLDDLKNQENLQIAFTPDSPSHHLLKTVAVDFGIDRLLDRRGAWQKEVTGSEEALKALKSGGVEVAVLWEPDVSNAIAAGSAVKLLGSESAAGLIVDALVVNRSFLQDKSEFVHDFLDTYFATMIEYRKDRDGFLEDLAKDASVSAKVAEEIAASIAWKSLHENAVFWFGLKAESATPRYGLYNSIERTVDVLKDFGDFQDSPLPGSDPRSLILDTYVATLFENAKMAGELGGADLNEVLAYDFAPLSDAAWERLPSVGTLKLRPISFQSGADRLTSEGEAGVKRMIETLRNYPDFRVVVAGHTSQRGDAEANKALSRGRAEAAAEYIVEAFAVDPDRVRAVGYGGDRPLRRNPGESYRAHQGRLSRVEFSFVRDGF